MTKKAIIYSRVSSDEQVKGTSLDNQEETSLVYAQSLGLEVVATFREDYTGLTLDRPELNKVREMLRTGKADVLIAYKPNRLDRSEWGVNLLVLLQQLKSLGIELHYSETKRQIDLNNPIEALMQSISGWQAGEDHSETIKKLSTGRRESVKKGNAIVHGRAPFGYIKKGEKLNWSLEIDEEQARIVRLIYNWYLHGDETGPLSTEAIAKKLTKMGIPTRGDKDKSFAKKKAGRWDRSTVSYILGCETYAGVYLYGKFNKSKAKGNYGKNPRSTWQAVDVPPIIDRQTWEEAQKRKDYNAQMYSGKRANEECLMRRRLTCSVCGYKLIVRRTTNRTGKKYVYYTCAAPSHGVVCDLPSFRVDKVDPAVWSYLDEIAHDPGKLEQGLKGYQAQTQDKLIPIQDEISHIEALLVEKHQEWQDNVTNLEIVTSKKAKAKFALDLEQTETIIEELETKKEILLAQLNQKSITDEEIDQIKRFMRMIANDWEIISQSFEGRSLLIERLGIMGRAVIEGDELVVYIRGKITADEKRLSIETRTTHNSSQNEQHYYWFEARLVVCSV